MLARGFQKYIANLPDHDVEVIHEESTATLPDAHREKGNKFKISIPRIQHVRIFIKTMVNLQLGERKQPFKPTNEEADDASLTKYKPVVLYDVVCSYHANIVKQLGGNFCPSLIGEPVVA